LINRFFDGLDGAVARRNGITSLGGFLDITCDFIFYSAVILGFALAAPEQNSLAATFLIFSFIGTGASFLAFAAVAEKHGISSEAHGQKAFYYLEGLAEGTETILFYIIICLFPGYFPALAVIFGINCCRTIWFCVFIITLKGVSQKSFFRKPSRINIGFFTSHSLTVLRIIYAGHWLKFLRLFR